MQVKENFMRAMQLLNQEERLGKRCSRCGLSTSVKYIDPITKKCYCSKCVLIVTHLDFNDCTSTES